jgi:hypothetical protein
MSQNVTKVAYIKVLLPLKSRVMIFRVRFGITKVKQNVTPENGNSY